MIYHLDVENKDFTVTQPPQPKVDAQGVVRTDLQTGEPLWKTQLCVTDESGGEIIVVTTRGPRPDVEVGDIVDVFELVMRPWNSGSRSGVSFTAREIKLVPERA